MMKLRACGKSNAGLLRKNNEDRCYADPDGNLFIVADGMGGHAAGEIASEMAVETICHQLLPIPSLPKNSAENLTKAINHTHLLIQNAAAENSAWHNMGTTLSILQLHDTEGFLAHIGDSRIYRYRDGQLGQLTEDHSLVAEQLRSGLISAEEARTSTMRNIISQAVGLTDPLEIFHNHVELKSKDCFLLCSDGLTDMLSDKEIQDAFEKLENPEILCDSLIEKANECGGRDNITVVIIAID